MSTWIVAEAAVLAAQSGVMLGVAGAAVVGAHATGVASSRRAIQPALDWRSAFVSGAHDEADAVKAPLRQHDWATVVEPVLAMRGTPPQRRARAASTLVAAAVFGLLGAATLAVTGHAPSSASLAGLAFIAVAAAVVAAFHVSRSAAVRSVLTRRGLHLLASSGFAEASSALAMLVAVVVVSHTAGLTAISIVEVTAIALATRLAIRVTPLPGGAGIADTVFLVPLTWIGVPLPGGLSAWLIWRAGSLVATACALAIARCTSPPATPGEAPSSTDGGRLLHRALFGSLSLLPMSVRDAARRRTFDAMFALSEDPWGYQQLPYEKRKQQALLAEVGPTAAVVVEVGCADGHNLNALARHLPDSTIVGSDVSSVAVRIAAQRTRELANVRVISTEAYDDLADSLSGRVDCIVLAEVLYYLVSERAIRDALAPLITMASPHCRVIMLHGSADAYALHERAVHALGLRRLHTRRIDDPERPFTLAVAGLVRGVPPSCP